MTSLFAALLLATQTVAATAPAPCAGPDPAIVSVAVKGVTPDGDVNHYQMSGQVVNDGTTAQASNVLQFVDIYQAGTKLDAEGIPPLKAGQTYTFSYTATRSNQAGNGSSRLTFKLDQSTSPATGVQDCNLDNDSFSLQY